MSIEKVIGRSGKKDEGSHWLTISDLMAGLMMIFLFIAIIFMRHLEESIGKDAVPKWRYDRVVTERDQLRAALTRLEKKHEQLVSKHQLLEEKYAQLLLQHQKLTADHQQLEGEHRQLQADYEEIRKELDRVRQRLQSLLEIFNEIEEKYKDLEASHDEAIMDLRQKERRIEELLLLVAKLEERLLALSDLTPDELRKLIADIEWIRTHLSQILQEFHMAAQHQLLQEISEEVSRRGLNVEIDHRNSVLRLTEDTVRFSFATDDERYRAHYDNTRKALTTLKKIGSVLADVLPCYAEVHHDQCSPLYSGTLKSVLIEGHSDKGGVGGSLFGGHQNQYHSVLRAMTVYQDLVQKNVQLDTLKNVDGNKLFAVTGYGTDRPLPGHEHTESDVENRRIELRFIMTPPKIDPEIMQRIDQLGVR